jgi:mevalonate kinase
MLDSRQVTASAPGKTILFGEHAVVYGKPAIAAAVDKRAYVTISKREDHLTHVTVGDLGVSGFLDLKNRTIQLENGSGMQRGILEYILKALIKAKTEESVEVDVRLDIPIGAGLGSSAAVTVATIMAAASFNQITLTNETMANLAHQVELDVQGAASPIDTSLSTYGGVIYLSKQPQKLVKLEIPHELPIVIGYTSTRGNTGELVKLVRQKKDARPEVINPILDSMEAVANGARQAIIKGDHKTIGLLMNINQGLLDALGVNTEELSKMVFTARNQGAMGSKLTGAGGGGSMIAYCPGREEEVVSSINQFERAFQINVAHEGVRLEKPRN